jgi:hypothetical protein
VSSPGYIKRSKRGHWWLLPIDGDDKVTEEAFEVSQDYLYKILNYADKEEPIPKDELELARKIFAFCKQGPKATHFLFSKNGKLVSADVLYILTSTLPSKNIGESYGVSDRKIREIRAGKCEEWHFEWILVRRLRAIIKSNLRRTNVSDKNTIIYSLSKVYGPKDKRILYYFSSKRKAKILRDSILTKEERYKFGRDKTLIDIIYPIEQVDVMH